MYQKGSRFQPTTVEMVDGETSPPLLLSEADLIALMEKHGIGQYGQRGLSLLGELCSQLLSLPGTSSVPPSEQGVLYESLQIRIYLNIQNRGIVETCGQIPGVLRGLQSVSSTEGMCSLGSGACLHLIGLSANRT